ncbi:aminopeptidase [Flavobacterium sp.]|uniref:aminopeptidase n=1 Tax=Flavobacterium sp. TaxID=239 RepID=UPI0028BDEE51|nr:aminopeptidase [Flavobacterium sp.]
MRKKSALFIKITFVLFLTFLVETLIAQNRSAIQATFDANTKKIQVRQEINFVNNSSVVLKEIVLNDWNNAYSDKNSALGKRFSDEFVRIFHLAKEDDRGYTKILSINNQVGDSLPFVRTENQSDLLTIQLQKELLPNESVSIQLNYEVKIPNDRFTRYGFRNDDSFILKNWFLTPSRLEASGFIKNSNENLDDIANSEFDYQINFTLDSKYQLFTDLNVLDKVESDITKTYSLNGKNRTDFDISIEPQPTFYSYKNNKIEVVTNLKDKRLDEIQRALIIDKVTQYVAEEFGAPSQEKILISQTDYDRNPFYGLNQLPAFISPFPDSFLYEIKFLKVYLDKYLKTSLQLNPRKDTWVYDGLQSYLTMKYIRDNYPDMKMMGNLSDWKLLKGYNLFKADFNHQFSYVYLLMARKNLDQAIGDDKNTFIKFNEQIAGKYRAGMSLNYLDDYLGSGIVTASINEFIALNQKQQTDESDFEKIIKNKTSKEVDWFFRTVVETRDLIDFKIKDVEETPENYQITIKNKTQTNVPVSLYGIKDDKVVFKEWVSNIAKDSTVTVPKVDVDHFVLNYNNEIPEYNSRNNWKALKSFLGNNRPYKFTFVKDLEDSKVNQIFFVPEFSYNLYDGVSPGLSFHNKSLLDKPFIFDVTPIYSSKTKELIGGAFFTVNQNVREDRLYNIRYMLAANTYHYAPNAAYSKIVPAISFRFRDLDYRANKKEFVTVRHVFVNREESSFATKNDENYSVFNLRHSIVDSEITHFYNVSTDVQVASNFGKLSGEIQFRRLFDNNRQINFRFFAGAFMYRSTNSEFFSFGLDRPTDYLFDYGLLGRSESTGLFSQQYIMAEGGFKSKFENRFANQWMTTVNASFNIWNWVEIYGDAGLMKSEAIATEFVYDSGIRLNLVPDYFELYFPVYSKNGWEIAQDNYDEKIRFVITISPKTLISLFTRKWF